jgi:RNA polymerase sigma-70 factor, ECF subfamily
MTSLEEGLDAFMRTDYARLVATLGIVTGSDAVAEDLVQDALVRVLSASHRGVEVRSFGALVRVTALNLSKNRWRTLAREERAWSRHSRTAQGLDAHGGSESELDVRGALKGLPIREREAAALFYQLDLSVAEVAELMGVHPGTVKTLLHRARAGLLEVFQPELKYE